MIQRTNSLTLTLSLSLALTLSLAEKDFSRSVQFVRKLVSTGFFFAWIFRSRCCLPSKFVSPNSSSSMDAYEPRLRESTYCVSPSRSLVSLAVWHDESVVVARYVHMYTYYCRSASFDETISSRSGHTSRSSPRHLYRCISATTDRVTFYVRWKRSNLISIALVFFNISMTTTLASGSVCMMNLRAFPCRSNQTSIYIYMYVCTMDRLFATMMIDVSKSVNPRTEAVIFFLNRWVISATKVYETRATTVERYSCMCVSVDFFFFFNIYIYVYKKSRGVAAIFQCGARFPKKERKKKIEKERKKNCIRSFSTHTRQKNGSLSLSLFRI